eukprot:SAG25_NODE_1185_length_3673_cov_2.798487_2_plen_80_part_00
MSEDIEHPRHYTQGEVECIDAMVSAFGGEAVRDYCRLNAFKYVWRAKEKDSVESNTRKAIWFLRMSVGDDPRQERGREC